jgi:hypothetical protein
MAAMVDNLTVKALTNEEATLLTLIEADRPEDDANKRDRKTT